MVTHTGRDDIDYIDYIDYIEECLKFIYFVSLNIHDSLQLQNLFFFNSFIKPLKDRSFI